MNLGLSGVLGQDDYSWVVDWWQQITEPSEYTAWYEQQVELVDPSFWEVQREARSQTESEFSFMTSDQLNWIKQAWSACGAQSLYSDVLPGMPGEIQWALAMSLQDTNPFKPVGRFDIPQGYNFYDVICVIVRDALKSTSGTSAAVSLIRNDLESIGFSASQADRFATELITPRVSAFISNQQSVDTTLPGAKVESTKMSLTSPLLLITGLLIGGVLLLKRR